MSPRFVVTARSDGRGGFRPFGTFGAAQAGREVQIGDTNYKVGKDGRVNIPKAIMNSMGVQGVDGRMRVAIQFASAPSILDIDHYAAVVSSLPGEMMNANTGDIVPRTITPSSALEPADSMDFNWSP
jgi:hypothetical protein